MEPIKYRYFLIIKACIEIVCNYLHWEICTVLNMCIDRVEEIEEEVDEEAEIEAKLAQAEAEERKTLKK